MMPPIKFTAMAVGRENKIPLTTYKIPPYITMLTLFNEKHQGDTDCENRILRSIIHNAFNRDFIPVNEANKNEAYPESNTYRFG